MKRIWAFSATVLLCLNVSGRATVINIPADYPTIQQGIDASIDGDTVLVQPGTYVENINFNGHNIVLGSLFLTTGDTSHIQSTIIDGALSGPAVTFVSNEDSLAIITGFTIQNGRSSTGGGISCINARPKIKFNILSENIAVPDGRGGGIYCEFADPYISGNIITNNHASWDGGGIHCRYDSYPLIIENHISGNTAADSTGSGRGGGIYVYMADPVIKGNTIVNNIAYGEWGGIGAGLCISESDAIMVNNTISFNISRNGPSSNGTCGGLFCVANSNLILTNNIFWRDSSATFPELYIDGTTTYNINYNDIEGGGWPGVGNIDIDPLFRYAAGGNFHLKFTPCGDTLDSPCIDAGDPDLIDRSLQCDLGLGTIASDMGAFGGYVEFSGCDYIPGDVNGSASYNGLDITFGVSFFKGGNPPLCPECPLCPDWFYCGDVNGSCDYNGLDITYGVAYFKGGPDPVPCADCPPAN